MCEAVTRVSCGGDFGHHSLSEQLGGKAQQFACNRKFASYLRMRAITVEFCNTVLFLHRPIDLPPIVGMYLRNLF